MLQDLSDLQDSVSDVCRTTVIKVEGELCSGTFTCSNESCLTGMTCQSCVRNITANMLEKPGVESVDVSLEEERATVSYDPSVTDPSLIASKSLR